MYTQYYQLKENPFSVTCDPAFFFTSPQHMEAFSHLLYGINQRKGILMVTGEIGTGKTTLCRTLLNHLDNKTKTALILNPNFSELQLLQLIIKDFGIQGHYRDKFSIITVLNEFLLAEAAKGNNVVIIIDEAQNLKVNLLEQIRLLSNLETEKAKLLQIILVGQPELLEKLKLPTLRQLNQRVAVRYHILPFNRADLQSYVNHRLKIAREVDHSQHQILFTKQALDALFQYSQGTPRRVNILCDRALLAGFVEETFVIHEQIIHKVAQEVI